MFSLVRLYDFIKRFLKYSNSVTYKETHLDGFFRALVLCSNDPIEAGRVKVFIPALMDEKYKNKAHGIWAWPTAFWAAANHNAVNDHSYNMMKDFGGFMPPPDGSFVYVFFENGDFTKPRYLPFGPALASGDKAKDHDLDSMIPGENKQGAMPWFKWTLMKSPFGRGFFVSDDPTDAMVLIRGYSRLVQGNCKSPTKNCNPSIPDKGIGPYHCGGQGSDKYKDLNTPKAMYNSSSNIAHSMFLIYEGHSDEGPTHDLVLIRDYRHNFIKFSSAEWTASPHPPDKGHCNESKDQIEWAIMEHEKERDKTRYDRLYIHANIKYILNTEKSYACKDDKFEINEDNLKDMIQMPDWVDQEINGHRLWMNLINGNPIDGCGGSGSINYNDDCSPECDVIYDGDCKWRSEDSHKERRAMGIFRSEHLLKWIVGDDTPSDESLFTEYHSGKRFMEYLFNGEFLIQDENLLGDKGFIELFPCDCTLDVNGEGDSKFYMRLKDGHALWESVKADTHIEFMPDGDCVCDPKGQTSNFLILKGNGQTLWQSMENMFIEQVPTGLCSCNPNGNGETFYRQESNGHIIIQSKANMFIELRPTGSNSCPVGVGQNFLLIEENGHMLWKNAQGSYIEFKTNGDIIINSVAGGGNVYIN